LRSDALSQDEIDALLRAVSTDGGVNSIDHEPDVESDSSTVAYDFKRPKLISKDQKRAIQIIYDTFAKNFANSLSLYLRTNVQLDVTLIEQFTYGEYIMSLKESTCMNLFSMAPLEGLSIFEINMPAVGAIIDRLMGGEGTACDIQRELTEIEKTVIGGVVNIALKQMHEAWQHIMDLDFVSEGIETKPQFAQIVGLTSNVLLVQFNITVGKVLSSMSICLPFDVVVPVLGRLTTQKWIHSGIRGQGQDTSLIQRQIPQVETEIMVELGQTQLRVKELLELRENDVMFLDSSTRDPVLVKIGGIPKYRAKPGVAGTKKAVQILQVIE